MEIKIIVLIVLSLIIMVGLCFLIYQVDKVEKKSMYVHPKTGSKYKVLYRCKLKVPISDGPWMDALIYVRLSDGKLYVRERKEFFDKFIRLDDWKNGSNKEGKLL